MCERPTALNPAKLCNLKLQNAKAYRKKSIFIDLGHRCIRTTFSTEGTILKLKNHIVGKDAEESSKRIRSKPDLKLKADRWYNITIEIIDSLAVASSQDARQFREPKIS